MKRKININIIKWSQNQYVLHTGYTAQHLLYNKSVVLSVFSPYCPLLPTFERRIERFLWYIFIHIRQTNGARRTLSLMHACVCMGRLFFLLLSCALESCNETHGLTQMGARATETG